jgi:Tol biopolymer transport system component
MRHLIVRPGARRATVILIAPSTFAGRAITLGRDRAPMSRTVVAVAALVVLILAACSAPESPAASDAPSTSAVEESSAPSPSSSAEFVEPTPAATPAWTGHPAEGLAMVQQVGGDDPTTQVFIVEADGSFRQVTGLSNALGASFPVWSPDGSRLAFNDPKVGSGLYGQVGIVNADGSGELSFGEGRDHRWSPDGTRIVFWESDPVGNEETSMYLLDVASGEVRDIGLGAQPQWLPDGQRISFIRTIELDGGAIAPALHVMSVDGGEAQLIAQDTIAYWSPDGTSVLLEREGVISLADGDFGNPRELADGFSPVWAPDSQSFVVAYDHDGDGNPVLALVNLEGLATWSGVSGSMPTWSPDGTRLAVEVYDPEFGIVRVIESATGSVVFESEGKQPAWRP